MAKTKLETVSDIETAKGVFVARALYWVAEYGNNGNADRALRHAGLGDYIPTKSDFYQVSTADLVTALGETIKVEAARGRIPYTDNVSDAVYKIASVWARELRDKEGSFVKIDPPAKQINFDDLLKRFGAFGTLPEATQEAVACWRELVGKILEWGDQHGVCPDLEAALTRMGFKVFLPPQEVDAVVIWNGNEIQLFKVRANRKGEPREDHVLDAIYRRVNEDYKANKITFQTSAPAEATA